MRISDWSSDVCSSDLITHDLDTLYAICDRVAVLADRKVVAVGPLSEIENLDHPWVHEYFNGPRGRAARDAEAGIAEVSCSMATKANYVLIVAFTILVSRFLFVFALWAAKRREARRVGNERLRACCLLWSPFHTKKNT